MIQIVDRALAFDKDERWQSAAEMLAAVERAQAELCGAPDREHLAVLARASKGWAATSPTEASPDTSSDSTDDEGSGRAGLGANRPRPTLATSLPPRSILTTTSKPVAGDRNQAASRTKPVVVVLALVAVVGAVLALKLARPPSTATASRPGPAPLVLQSPTKSVRKPPAPLGTPPTPSPFAAAQMREPPTPVKAVPKRAHKARPSAASTLPVLPGTVTTNDALPTKPTQPQTPPHDPLQIELE